MKLPPHKQGHRDAARGIETENPFTKPNAAQSWRESYERVETFRARGLDPNGHAPPPPHLCLRDAPKYVCNCCSSCAAACKVEDDAPQPQRISIDHVAWAVVRIADALERHEYSTARRETPCPACGSRAPIDARSACSTCGATC